MDAVSLIVGALLLGAGFFAGTYFRADTDDGHDDECTKAYKKEYARNNGLYEARRR